MKYTKRFVVIKHYSQDAFQDLVHDELAEMNDDWFANNLRSYYKMWVLRAKECGLPVPGRERKWLTHYPNGKPIKEKDNTDADRQVIAYGI